MFLVLDAVEMNVVDDIVLLFDVNVPAVTVKTEEQRNAPTSEAVAPGLLIVTAPANVLPLEVIACVPLDPANVRVPFQVGVPFVVSYFQFPVQVTDDAPESTPAHPVASKSLRVSVPLITTPPLFEFVIVRSRMTVPAPVKVSEPEPAPVKMTSFHVFPPPANVLPVDVALLIVIESGGDVTVSVETVLITDAVPVSVHAEPAPIRARVEAPALLYVVHLKVLPLQSNVPSVWVTVDVDENASPSCQVPPAPLNVTVPPKINPALVIMPVPVVPLNVSPP